MQSASLPFSFILFGASGHLARIKIFPALYFLALKKRFPEHYAIVGYARTSLSHEEFRAIIRDSIQSYVPEVNEGVLAELLKHCHYHSGQYDRTDDFKALATLLQSLENGQPNVVRLAYLSIPPSAFSATIENLCKGGVHTHGAPFRLLLEKPVGTDETSCEAIFQKMNGCFSEDDIYILDHYLGKEAVRNVYYLRHANPIIERLLKHTLITNIQISAMETDGLEGRAGYFDSVGTLRDMVQSHLLEIAALLTMRLCDTIGGIKSARLSALKDLFIPEKNSTPIVQGQYEKGMVGKQNVQGYREEEGVSEHSRTPTFVALEVQTKAERFMGVPIFLRSGKRLKTKETRISIEFRESPTLIGKNENRNRLDIILQGEAGMKLHLQTKIGGREPQFRPLIMEDPLVCMGDCLIEHSLLLLEAINGNKEWFLDEEEVRTCWKLIDPLQRSLDDPSAPLAMYNAGTTGPQEADQYIEERGYQWL